MSRTLALAFAGLLAVNAVVGTIALSRTLHLGQASHKASSALVAKRTAQLDRFEASLHAQLAKKPPPLPPMPAASPAGAASISAAPTASVQQVRYVRPAPIVVHKHRAGSEHESEALGGDREGGLDD